MTSTAREASCCDPNTIARGGLPRRCTGRKFIVCRPAQECGLYSVRTGRRMCKPRLASPKPEGLKAVPNLSSRTRHAQEAPMGKIGQAWDRKRRVHDTAGNLVHSLSSGEWDQLGLFGSIRMYGGSRRRSFSHAEALLPTEESLLRDFTSGPLYLDAAEEWEKHIISCQAPGGVNPVYDMHEVFAMDRLRGLEDEGHGDFMYKRWGTEKFMTPKQLAKRSGVASPLFQPRGATAVTMDPVPAINRTLTLAPTVSRPHTSGGLGRKAGGGFAELAHWPERDARAQQLGLELGSIRKTLRSRGA